MGFTGVVTAAKRIVPMAILAFALNQQGAYAHEGEHHGDHGKHDDHEAMEKLHKLMPMYAQAQTKIKEALANGDAATIKTETGNILKTIPDLKRSKPHKNLREIGTFKKLATAFGGDVKKTDELAKAGNFVKAKDAFHFAQNRCNECHVKFRD